MVFLLYNLLFPVMLLIMLPYFLLRMCRRGGYSKGFAQRLGWYDPKLRERLRERSRVWIHAVSVGETFVALRFMEEWRKSDPALAFVMSVNTSTAHALAEKSMSPDDVLVYFPLDFPPVIQSVMRQVKPRMLVLTECEFWPNLIRSCERRKLPVLLINGRLSDRSFRGYRRFRHLFTPVLRMVDHLCVQGGQDLSRYQELGVSSERIQCVGSAKYDVAIKAPGDPDKAAVILKAAGMCGGGDTILLGGSTWPGEEDLLLDYFMRARSSYSGLKLILAPRHAERREEVVAAIRQRGLSFAQRSRCVDAPVRMAPEVLLLDSTGELRHLYTAASLIFIGKSLTQHGGQNIIEPAVCGKPIVVGPNMENFRDITRDFLAYGALIQVHSVTELDSVLNQLLGDPEQRNIIGEKAARLVEKNRGSIHASVAVASVLLSGKAHA